MRGARCSVASAALVAAACGGASAEPTGGVAPAPRLGLPEETHLAGVRQLTFGGENAEAYWSFDGRSLVYQAHTGPGCDQIYTMNVADASPSPTLVSTGTGATTCAYFLPGNREIVYASTHLGGAACPPKPDRSQGYVWAIYDTYDIFRARTDGSGLVRLTDTPGYDAEATVCGKDGSIVFTSLRDGDLDLYRMDADGKNVRRLTNTPGYDGGAFFSPDCSLLVWRASRPEGDALADYRRLLGQGLVRPSKLEIVVGDADGSNARQITYLDAAAFAPFFHPSGRRVLFSTNFGDPKGREFDLWAVNVDGTGLERITYAPGFDGFPMFSPDGRLLAFASNRANAPGSRDTNVFVAEWREHAPNVQKGAADRVMADVAWLADPAREGRGVGTAGLKAAGEFLEARLKELGAEPAGTAGFRQTVEIPTRVTIAPGTRLEVAGAVLAPDSFQPLAGSGSGDAAAPLVLAGWGVRIPALGLDDYAGLDVTGKIVVVRRFVPDGEHFASEDAKRRHGDLRHKAWLARERGAVALLVVDAPARPKDAPSDWKVPDEARFPALTVEGHGDAGIPVLLVRRPAMLDVLAKLEKKRAVRASLSVRLDVERSSAFNVAARIRSGAPAVDRLPGALVIGAHYDHLGRGGEGSLAPGSTEAHVGADDNASGVAALLEITRSLIAARSTLRRDVVVVAFTGEESGLVGSTHFVKQLPAPAADVFAMLNLDMVGRLRDNRLSVLGADSAAEWKALVNAACAASRVQCVPAGDGYGPSDHTPFYAAGIPVLHFFTGAHRDYHKPSDTADLVNAAGAARIAEIVALLAKRVTEHGSPLTFESAPSPAPRGDRRSFNASLGTVPDYTGPPDGKPGVVLAGVRAGSAAERSGLRRGDLLVGLGPHPIRNVRDLMYVLESSKPGETVKAKIERQGAALELEVTFEERGRAH